MYRILSLATLFLFITVSIATPLPAHLQRLGALKNAIGGAIRGDIVHAHASKGLSRNVHLPKVTNSKKQVWSIDKHRFRNHHSSPIVHATPLSFQLHRLGAPNHPVGGAIRPKNWHKKGDIVHGHASKGLSRNIHFRNHHDSAIVHDGGHDVSAPLPVQLHRVGGRNNPIGGAIRPQDWHMIGDIVHPHPSKGLSLNIHPPEVTNAKKQKVHSIDAQHLKDHPDFAIVHNGGLDDGAGGVHPPGHASLIYHGEPIHKDELRDKIKNLPWHSTPVKSEESEKSEKSD